MSPQWADQPLSLIPTLPFSKNTSHSAYYVATQMALAHNGMIRGLNSIYLQALQVPASDFSTVRDFLTYCQCWCESMHHHHDTEEEQFFPEIEKITGIPELMEANVAQHRAFTPGFEAFDAYARSCHPKDYDGKKMKELIDAFAAPLHRHLVDEINTLKALDKYDSEGIRLAYKRFEKSAMNTNKYRIGPLVFGTADRAFEGGIHNFPPVPFFVPYVIRYAFERPHRGAWRFSPCTTWRDRRDLLFASASNTS
ncbi:hypothetical protein P171DRAFT_428563 [Karstenula rhodostoma CBS 690.94]|uniref:Hemerythrin-like domain-containing protein n=1 Tax=Karstenula rhodostoma CBS 690.94 TaxID=1392251 RepID=A0A9P4PSM1_9PLEO|nr:hypothetical protein P171DRAFT_428563 [Karstenula rhodostoma CBS 690.94]